MPAHPHARGEHELPRPPNSTRIGSSPRTWGTQGHMLSRYRLRRLIPTHVGNTCPTSGATSCTAAHPHARGEHDRVSARLSAPDGSSPRTWGTRGEAARMQLPTRLIPTHVGNTFFPPLLFLLLSAHPHARGEHPRNKGGAPKVCGSSPRTWGTQPIHLQYVASQRLIPTHVGNTRMLLTSSCSLAAHPHARGEHAKTEKSMHSFYGSSPRTWGTLRSDYSPVLFFRLIPTHVGNTRLSPNW